MFLDRIMFTTSFSEEKGLTKNSMVVGKLLFSRLMGLQEKHDFCGLAHFYDPKHLRI